jgi:hypothetical protein
MRINYSFNRLFFNLLNEKLMSYLNPNSEFSDSGFKEGDKNAND